MSRRTALPRRAAVLVAALMVLSACGDEATQPVDSGFGPNPTLPKPKETLLPTVNIAPAKGWPAGAKPTPAEGLAVTAFADGLDHPRWLHVLPNGDVLVAESDAPERPEEEKGVKSWVMGLFMRRAGSHLKSADRITLLRDSDRDGIAETRSAFIERLHSPFGMALIGDSLYVANADSIVRFPYREGDTRISASPEKLVALPGGPLNHHWTKSLIASPDVRFLYVGVGSNSNVGENGLAAEEGRAAIWEIEVATGRHRIFASGLRNPVGMAFEPTTGALWVAVNERDGLGSDLVPDYMTAVKDGGFYGWPYSYFGHHVDERVEPPRPDLVAQAIVPDYALGAHTASLGLALADGTALGGRFQRGAFIGQHGSWNRKPLSGYKVIFVPFQDGRPLGKPIDVLTGFVNADGEALGRPVGVAIDKTGALLVADDAGNRVWRVTSAQARPVAAR